MARKRAQSHATNTNIINSKQVGISLSKNAVNNIELMVKETGLSRSKLIENLVTGAIAVSSRNAEKTITIAADTEDIKITEGVVEAKAFVSQEEKSDVKGTNTDTQSQIVPLTEIDSVVNEIANKTHESKIQVLRKAMSLMKIVIQAQEHGYKFGLTKDSKVLDSEISL